MHNTWISYRGRVLVKGWPAALIMIVTPTAILASGIMLGLAFR